jgi:hypothetical protein
MLMDLSTNYLMGDMRLAAMPHEARMCFQAELQYCQPTLSKKA